MKVKIKTRPCGLTEFYVEAAKAYIKEIFNGNVEAIDFSAYKFDCRQINISNAMQDKFYEHYEKCIRKADNKMLGVDIRINITMLLAMSGPKVDENLDDDEVEIFEGFIC